MFPFLIKGEPLNWLCVVIINRSLIYHTYPPTPLLKLPFPHLTLNRVSFIAQKLEFHTATGTALYPYSFSINYEFVDTEMGGDLLGFDENDEEDKKAENEFALCSRTFRNRRGEFRSPRNVFLHGRGGAKNLSCLYRFEASLGEQVRKRFYFIDFASLAIRLV